MHQIQKDKDVFASKTDAEIRDGILTDDEAHYNFCFCLPSKTKILYKTDNWKLHLPS